MKPRPIAPPNPVMQGRGAAKGGGEEETHTDEIDATWPALRPHNLKEKTEWKI